MGVRWVMLIAGAVGLSCSPAMAPLPPEPPALLLPMAQGGASAVGGGATSGASGGVARGDAPAERWCERAVPTLAGCQLVGNVRVKNVLVDLDCYVDLLVHENDVGQIMACPSAGVVVFEKATFAGDLGGGHLDVCASTTYIYPPADTCDWKSMQRIHGPLDQLSLTYTEDHLNGSKCARACRVTATVERVP